MKKRSKNLFSCCDGDTARNWGLPALFMLPVMAAAACILVVRGVLGFQFPVPWPDETGFIAPAFDFARTGSFFDPGMNPDRVVMWMPPGYMVFLAAVFRIFGYGFSLARWVSALCGLACLGVTAVLAWRVTYRWRRVLAGAALSLAFVTPYFLIDTNIARMEMLFCCVILLALTALAAQRPWLAAALLAIAALVHFNAVYFMPVALLAFLILLRAGQLPAMRLTDGLALAAAALAAGLYGVQIAQNWHGFVADMAFQFAAKRFAGQNDPAHPIWIAAAGVALASVVLRRRWVFDRAAMIALFGVAFLLMAHGGHELWYDYGQPLGFALIAVALLAERGCPGPAPTWLAGAAAASACLVLVVGLRITPAMAALRPHVAMLHRDVVAHSEIAKVRAFIATLHPGETVNFGWSGMEPFFLADLARAGARWTILRHSVTEIWPLRAADWRVRCDSSENPGIMFVFDIDYPRRGQDSGCDIIRYRQHGK